MVFGLGGEGGRCGRGSSGGFHGLRKTLEGGGGFLLEIVNLSVQRGHGGSVGGGILAGWGPLGQLVGEVVQIRLDRADLSSNGVCEEGGGIQDWPDRPARLQVKGIMDAQYEVVLERLVWGFL